MPLDKRQIGNRLFKIRHIVGLDRHGGQQAFAEIYAGGTKKGTYSVWEKGGGVPPVDDALTIVETLNNGIGLDYIYRGRFDGIPEPLAGRLRAAPDRNRKPRAVRRLREPPPSDADAAAAFAPRRPAPKGTSRKREM